mmetsp:Transcript_2024/g.2451  ORF Transcript_2024/g.2451 Transcript_2024/m.2451 type:complete len:99 (-) Transcript_2024:686-982(-)
MVLSLMLFWARVKHLMNMEGALKIQNERRANNDIINAKAELLALQKEILTKAPDSGGILKEQQLEGHSLLNLLQPRYFACNGYDTANTDQANTDPADN